MLVDEIGFAQFSMGMVAERLGVKTPSFFKHVSTWMIAFIDQGLEATNTARTRTATPSRKRQGVML